VSEFDQVVFGQFSPSLPHAVALDQGFYSGAGLEVTSRRVPSSPALMSALGAGELNIALTSPDNIANYRFNGAHAKEQGSDFRIVRAVDQGGSLSLVSRRGINSIHELRGATLAVDVKDSGFAYLAYEMLAGANLRPGSDYEVREFGGTPLRFASLLEGAIDVTILNAGFDYRAEREGCVRVGSTLDSVPDYLSTVLAASGAWIDGNADPVARFASVWQRSTGHILDAENEQYCLRLLENLLEIDHQLATAIYRSSLDSVGGLVPDGVVSSAQLRSVLGLRSRWGGFAVEPDPSEIEGIGGLVDRRFTSIG
jgi:ABC-type nitrate/sulfonate/bicarbonate transport system substrate-binding protein